MFIFLKSVHRAGFFVDQFENLANFRAHYKGTGLEIFEQTGGRLDAFVSRYLKDKNPSIKCYLIDPPGSGLFNKLTRGVMCTKEEAEGRRMENPFDTITNRLTQNFVAAKLDGAFRGTDRESVKMARFFYWYNGVQIWSFFCLDYFPISRCLHCFHIEYNTGKPILEGIPSFVLYRNEN